MASCALARFASKAAVMPAHKCPRRMGVRQMSGSAQTRELESENRASSWTKWHGTFFGNKPTTHHLPNRWERESEKVRLAKHTPQDSSSKRKMEKLIHKDVIPEAATVISAPSTTTEAAEVQEIQLPQIEAVTITEPAPEVVMEGVFRPRIAVVGIGGGGCNAVNNMIRGGLRGVDFLVCNTDAQSLDASLCENRLQLGEKATGGFGAGSNPEVGRMAAQESIQNVISRLHGTHMVFLTAGLGGGTGTGAAPLIANACRNEGILTVAIVTMPFDFEGKRARELAQTGLQKLQDQVDTVIVVPNQRLLDGTQRDLPLLDAFGEVDSVLFKGIEGVTDLVVRPGLINTDFADLRRIMQSNSGRGLMGTGEAEGEGRAIKAALAALEHPLLDDVDVSAARRVLVTISASSQVTMEEVDIVSTTIQSRVNVEALTIFGVTINPSMEQRIRVSVVATDMAESASSYDEQFGSTSSYQAATNARKRTKGRDGSSSRSSHKNGANESGGWFRGWL